MTGSKKKNKLSPRSKASAPPSPAVSTVHAAGVPSLPAGESNLHVHQTPSPAPVDEPPNSSSSAVASSSVLPQSSETKQRGRNNLSANDVEKPSASRWFLRTGTWPRSGSKKSTAVTKVAQETVSGTSTSPPPSIRPEQTVDTPAVIPEESHNRSSRSLVSAAPESVMAKKSVPSLKGTSRAPSINLEATETEHQTESTKVPEDIKDTNDANSKNISNDTKPNQTTVPAAGWFGWWYGAPAESQVPEAPKSEVSEEQAAEPPAVEIVIPREPTPPPPPPPSPPPQPAMPNPIPTELSGVPTLDGTMDSDTAPAPRPRSWFGFWAGQEPLAAPKIEKETEEISKSTTESSKDPSPSSSQNIPRTEANPVAEVATTTAAAATAGKQPDTQLLGAQTNIPALSPIPSSTETASSATSVAPIRSGWAFWSKERPKSVEIPSSSNTSSTTTVGQLAVADTPSQSNPQKAKVKDIATLSSAPAPAVEPKVARTISNLREETRPNTPKKPDSGASTVVAAPTTPQSSISASSSAAKQVLKKAVTTNHVLPEFESCYHRQNQPSMLCQITKIFKTQPPRPKRHLYLSPAPLRIRKAVAIGVHGFFPMRLVRTVLGEPTGTSIRFANSAAAAIKRWAEKNNVEVEIEKIALEGEGKVGDRVEMLWKLLSNWMDHVKNADFVLLAAHSQGVVVGVQLLARLIEEGCIKEKARVGFTAMAGINLGPFYHLPTTILTGSAKELFEFQKPESAPSQKYMQALEVVLKHNVRVLYVGSIDDQLVPLESSSFSNISHPYIFRAVFVDGRVHAPDFLSHLVGFAMKLRNQGISDHGLIRELSSPLAGSLYGGEGHSRIYDDEQVYDLGVRHALETTDCEGVSLKVEPFELPTNANNPFFLPWSMRGMLEEPHVKNRLQGECMQLLEQFENWKPSSKVLKDVKFRLEGIRSKL